jgi:ABC-2 type transport system permease protein
MFRSVEKAEALLAIGIKSSLAYRLDYLFFFCFRIIFALLMLFVWSAIYFASNTQSIAGISQQQMYAYYFLVGVMFSIITMEPGDQLQSDIRSGGVAIAFTRPINYAFQLFFHSLSVDLLYMIISIPLLVITAFFVALKLSLATLVLLAIEMAIGYALSSLISFMIGSLAVYLTETGGIMVVTWNIALLLAGGIMPLSLYPPLGSHVLLLLPFQMFIYTPVSTLLGTMTSAEAAKEIAVGSVWAIILFAVAALMWYRIRKSITSAGG